jgi:hypothetical protein
MFLKDRFYYKIPSFIFNLTAIVFFLSIIAILILPENIKAKYLIVPNFILLIIVISNRVYKEFHYKSLENIYKGRYINLSRNLRENGDGEDRYREIEEIRGLIEKEVENGVFANRDVIRIYLEGVVKNASETLNIPQDNLRANIFTIGENRKLRIPDGLHFNMDKKEELTVEIPEGWGCTGTAFEQQKVTIAILRDNWGQYILDEVELKKVHEDLVWIVSVPIMNPNREKQNECIGILNLDCLNVRKNEQEISAIVNDLRLWSSLISIILV